MAGNQVSRAPPVELMASSERFSTSGNYSARFVTDCTPWVTPNLLVRGGGDGWQKENPINPLDRSTGTENGNDADRWFCVRRTLYLAQGCALESAICAFVLFAALSPHSLPVLGAGASNHNLNATLLHLLQHMEAKWMGRWMMHCHRYNTYTLCNALRMMTHWHWPVLSLYAHVCVCMVTQKTK